MNKQIDQNDGSKCLLFLHLAGRLPKNMVILFRKDQILTAKWHDSKYVQLLAI